MPKRSRTYWIQLCYAERDDEWLEAFSDYNDACQMAAGLMVKRDATFALILRPWVRRGSVAADSAILADFQRENVDGAKKMTVYL